MLDLERANLTGLFLETCDEIILGTFAHVAGARVASEICVLGGCFLGRDTYNL